MRWKLIIAALLVIAGVLAFFLLREDSSTRTLADSSKLVLSGVRIGRTNVYTHGSFLSRTIGRFVPSNRVAIAGHDLRPPQKVTLHGWFDATQTVEVLTAQFHLLPKSARGDDFLKPGFPRKFRVLISGEDGFSYVHEFHGPYMFRQYPDGIFGYLQAQTFPRTSPTLHIRLEERAGDADRFREVATFTVDNPQPSRVASWKIENAPRLSISPEVTAEIGELVVRSETIHPSDIWDHVVELPVRFTCGGQVLTNWSCHEAKVRDASGNSDWFNASRIIADGSSLFRSHRVLDPRVPWRFELNFALDSDFPATNVFQVSFPWLMNRTIQTNLGGLPARLDFRFGGCLVVELLSQPEDRRLTLIDARDKTGWSVDGQSGSWSQHSFHRMLEPTPNSQNITATIAIHPNYPATFTLQPRFDKTPR